MKWIKENDVILRVLSLLLAVVLWVYVMGVKDPTTTETFSGLPVQLQGVDELSDKNLVILSGSSSTASVTVEGTRSDLSNLMKDLSALPVTASVTHINEPGEYNLSYVAETRGITGIKVLSKSPRQLSLVVDRMNTTSVPVEVILSGTPAENHTITDCVATPDAITVRGPESVLRQIKTARVEYSVDDLSAPLQTSVTYRLLDKDGEEVTSPFLTADTPSTTLTIGMKRSGAVALVAELTDSPYLTDSMVDVTIDPLSIMVTGSPEVVEELNQISLGNVNLSDVVEKERLRFDRMIVLPNGVSAVKGQPQYAAISLELKGCGWKTMELDQTALEPDEVLTYPNQVFRLRMFGSDDALARLTEEYVRLLPIYDLDELTAGEHMLPCKAVTDDGSVYLRQDLQVRVEVTQEALDAAREQPDDPDQPGETDVPPGETGDPGDPGTPGEPPQTDNP